MGSPYCVQAWVSGRVQGVFFRESTARRARALGLSGRAENLGDGRVKVIAAGAKESVHALLDWLHTGPPMSHVTGVDWQEYELPLDQSDEFITV